MHAGSPLGCEAKGKRPQRRFLLLGVFDLEEALSSPRERNRWVMWALPSDLVERVGGEEALACVGFEVGRIRDRLEASGVPRRTAERWPQALGFRIILMLLERGRVDFAILHRRQDVFRATRRRVPEVDFTHVKVSSEELLASLYAAGARPTKPRLGEANAAPREARIHIR